MDVFAGYSFSSSYNSVPFESPLQCGSVQWWIQGRGPGGGQVSTPYFFSETGPEGPKKFILETSAPPPYLRVWMTTPPVSDGLDLPLQFAVFRSRFPRFVHINGKFTLNISISPLFSVTEKQTFSYGRRNI